MHVFENNRMKNYSGVFVFAAVFACMLFFGSSASAATLFTTPQTGTHALQEKFSVSVKIDSQGDSINATQAHVTFPASILQVESVDVSGSVF